MPSTAETSTASPALAEADAPEGSAWIDKPLDVFHTEGTDITQREASCSAIQDCEETDWTTRPWPEPAEVVRTRNAWASARNLTVKMVPALIREFHPKCKGPYRLNGLIAFQTAIGSGEDSDTERYRDDRLWEFMLRARLTDSLLHCILDEHLCGFSKEELTTCVDDSERYLSQILPYILQCMRALVDLWRYFMQYTSEKRDYFPEEFINDELDAIIVEYPRLWERLWEVKTPFLDRQPRRIPENGGATPSMLHFALSTCATMNLYFERLRASFKTSPPSKIPHVMLTIWVHHEQRSSRNLPLFKMVEALYRTVDRHGPQAYSDFYKTIAAGSTASKYIHRAIIRDFKVTDEKHMRQVVSALIRVAKDVRPRQMSYINLDTPLERDVLYASLAACRTLLCTFNDDFKLLRPTLKLELEFARRALTNGGRPTWFPEQQIYALAVLLDKVTIPAIIQNWTDSLEDILHLTIFCDELLRTYGSLRPRDTSPEEMELVLARNRAYAVHDAVSAEIRRRPDVLRTDFWRDGLRRSWTSLGKRIDDAIAKSRRTSDDSPALSLPVLERCNWTGCLCRDFKPIHRLRICTGCHMVAYCNSRCQRTDWSDGGHKQYCRKVPSAC